MSCGLEINHNKIQLVPFQRVRNGPAFETVILNVFKIEHSGRAKFLGVIIERKSGLKHNVQETAHSFRNPIATLRGLILWQLSSLTYWDTLIDFAMSRKWMHPHQDRDSTPESSIQNWLTRCPITEEFFSSLVSMSLAITWSRSQAFDSYQSQVTDTYQGSLKQMRVQIKIC